MNEVYTLNIEQNFQDQLKSNKISQILYNFLFYVPSLIVLSILATIFSIFIVAILSAIIGIVFVVIGVAITLYFTIIWLALPIKLLSNLYKKITKMD